MSRRWGARAVAKLQKRIARTKRLPRRAVSSRRIEHTVKTRLVNISGSVNPGDKILRKTTSSWQSSADTMLKIMKKSSRQGRFSKNTARHGPQYKK